MKVLAFVHIALALAGLVAGAFACVSFWLIPGRFSNTVLAFAIPIFLFFAWRRSGRAARTGRRLRTG